jgi:hypothetical protein
MADRRLDEQPDLVERVTGPWLQHHPRSPDAGLERLREVLGIVKFNGPVPSWRDFAEEDGAPEPGQSDRSAGD